MLIAILSTFAIVTNYTGDQQRNAGLNLEVETGYCMHITIEVVRANGAYELIKDGVAINNAGELMDIGADWIEDQLGDSPSTDPAKWISVSTNSSSLPGDGSWTQIPNEIVANGLERAAGTYASVGVGSWTISYQFTASATHTDVQLTGLQWASSGDNNLVGADTFTPVSLEDGDKLTVTWTITVS